MTEPIRIDRIEQLPDVPEPWKLRDWQATARDFDAIAFDLSAKGEHLPLIWIDDENGPGEDPGFGMPTYVAGPPQRESGEHEAVACLGALVGASVADIDKRSGKHDFISMACQYYDEDNQQLVLNKVTERTGLSYWYEVFPHILFYILVDLYPRTPRLGRIMRITADRWAEACRVLSDGRDGPIDFDHTAFDFQSMRPVSNGKWIEPDAAAGIAWLLHAAYHRWPRRDYLDCARHCMDTLMVREANPLYEVLLPFAVPVAARLNAEHGADYDVAKLLRWSTGVSDVREGWGMISDQWGGLDCHGLMGSTIDFGGYAFAMNTFVSSSIIVPAARYDPRLARAIGRWLLNVANSARLFYPDELPPEHQSCPDWEPASRHAVCYEGVCKEYEGRSPYALGDPTRLNWGKLDFAIYGAAYAGLYAGVVHPTATRGVLALDCLATDFFAEQAYPTWLYYNPHDTPVTIAAPVGNDPKGVYDTVTHRWLSESTSGGLAVELPPDSARVLVITPPRPRQRREGRWRLAQGVVIDYAVPDA